MIDINSERYGYVRCIFGVLGVGRRSYRNYILNALIGNTHPPSY